MFDKITGSYNTLRRRILQDQRGNVLMFYGFAVIPLMFSVGMGVDYARAMKAQTKLNAAADAAALNSVSQTMMLQGTTAACEAARALFESQSAGIDSVEIDSVTYSVKKADGTEIGCATITDDAPPVDKRFVTVAYSARSTNLFGGILGWADLTISGGSGTYASVAPDIDFYIALDTSPSMGLPTTQQGMDKMADRAGCEFACHSNRIEHYVPVTVKTLVLDNVAFGLNKTVNIQSTRSERVCGAYTNSNVSGVTQFNCTTAGSRPATGKFVSGDSVSNYTNSSTNLTYTGPVTVIDSKGSYVFKNKTWTPSTYPGWSSSNKRDNRGCRADGVDSISVPSTPTRDICVRNDSPETKTVTTSPGSVSNPATVRVSSPSSVYVPPLANVYADTYWLAQNLGINLRVTDEKAAIADLMSLAAQYRTENQAEYRAALYTFDNAQDGVKSLSSLTSNLSSITAASSGVELAFINDNMGNGCAFKPTPINSQSDCSAPAYYHTSFTSILNRLAADIPTTKNSKPYPGNGTETSNPQGYIFIVTDGMSDEVKTNGFSNGVISTMSNSGNRTRTALTSHQLEQCNYLKNTRKLKIAILYTEYTLASIESDKVTDPTQYNLAKTAIGGSTGLAISATPGGTNIASRLTDCASPGLMYTVSTGESISNALQALFSKALASARIIQ